MKVYIMQSDQRSEMLKHLFQKDNALVSKIEDANTIYMGIKGEFPQCQGVEKIYNLVYCENIASECLKKGIQYEYLYSNPKFVLQNSKLTSQAMIYHFIQDNQCALMEQKILILGYGACGQALAKDLSFLGAKITIGCRNLNLKSKIISRGFNFACLTQLGIEQYKYIINTIPSNILQNDIDKITQNQKIYDLASFPYGLNDPKDKNYTILASLPSKYVYKSAAKLIYELIMEKEGENVKR